MANLSAKTKANIFYQARCAASKHNEALSNRESAADIMSIDRGRFYRFESGMAVPYPEEVQLMADLYNAPQLRNYYCRQCCPLGADTPKADIEDIDRITVMALATLRKVADTKDSLLDITADGIIDEDEKSILNEIIQTLDEINEISASLKNWVKRDEGSGLT